MSGLHMKTIKEGNSSRRGKQDADHEPFQPDKGHLGFQFPSKEELSEGFSWEELDFHVEELLAFLLYSVPASLSGYRLVPVRMLSDPFCSAAQWLAGLCALRLLWM